MMHASADPCVARYRDLKNLKLVGAELGIPWQTVYVRLKRAGEPVTGDKARYGSETDRLAARGERWFRRVIPDAIDQNATEFQSKVDFLVHGYGVDVKTSRPRPTKTGALRWNWSLKKQESVADYFVCLALTSRSGDAQVFRALLIPGELTRHYQTIGCGCDGSTLTGKWGQYACTSADLRAFFREVS